jgi:flavodoxin
MDNPKVFSVHKKGDTIMNKILKIVLIVLVLLVLAVAAFAGILFLDVSAYTATGSQTLSPEGNRGNALVVYDPGLSGAAKGVADKVAADLQTAGYTVVLAGIKSSAAVDTTGSNVIVVGGPIYAGAPTSSVKDFLSNLNLAANVKVGVFGSGSGPEESKDVEMIRKAITVPSNAVVAKIGTSEDLNARSADFVNRLLS